LMRLQNAHTVDRMDGFAAELLVISLPC
jgi:hypothetical protein